MGNKEKSEIQQSKVSLKWSKCVHLCAFIKTVSRLVYLFLCVKDLSLLVTGPPQLLLLEVSIVQSFGDLHARDVNFGVGGNGELLVSPAQGNSVQGKRAYMCANKKKMLGV